MTHIALAIVMGVLRWEGGSRIAETTRIASPEMCVAAVRVPGAWPPFRWPFRCFVPHGHPDYASAVPGRRSGAPAAVLLTGHRSAVPGLRRQQCLAAVLPRGGVGQSNRPTI